MARHTSRRTLSTCAAAIARLDTAGFELTDDPSDKDSRDIHEARRLLMQVLVRNDMIMPEMLSARVRKMTKAEKEQNCFEVRD